MSNGRVRLSRSDPWTGWNLDRRAAFPQKLHFARFVPVRGQSVARLVGPSRTRTLSIESGTKSSVGASVLKSPRVNKSNRARSLSPEIVEPQEPLLLLPGEGVLLFRACRSGGLPLHAWPGTGCGNSQGSRGTSGGSGSSLTRLLGTMTGRSFRCAATAALGGVVVVFAGLPKDPHDL